MLLGHPVGGQRLLAAALPARLCRQARLRLCWITCWPRLKAGKLACLKSRCKARAFAAVCLLTQPHSGLQPLCLSAGSLADLASQQAAGVAAGYFSLGCCPRAVLMALLPAVCHCAFSACTSAG